MKVDFQFEKKRCCLCKIEKLRVLDFSMKASRCRTCIRDLARKRRLKEGRDPKRRWRCFDWAVKSTNRRMDMI